MPLPKNCIKISDSANGKKRVIERKRIVIKEDLKEIAIITNRRFFEPDSNDADGLGIELTGKVDFAPYEHTLIANNDLDHQCNPDNGLVVRRYDTGQVDEGGNPIMGWKDVINNIVQNPIRLYDFFEPLMDDPIAIHAIVNQNILAEDQIYHTWDK